MERGNHNTTEQTSGWQLKEEQLKALIQRYKLLSDASVDAIVIHEYGKVLYTNKALTRDFGYERQELRGRPVEVLLNPAVHDIFIEALQGNDYEYFETIGKRKDGSSFTIEVHVKPPDRENDLYRAVVLRDITKRKTVERQLLRTETEYKKLFEDSMDAIYITSKNGNVVDVNNAFLELFGYKKSEMRHFDILGIYATPEDRSRFIENIEKRGAINDFEVKLVRKNGQVIDCLLSSSLRRSADNEIIGYQGIIRDISDLKKANEMKKAMELAERSADMKSRFLSNMSHEIRTPLNAIFGITNLLNETALSEQQRHYLDVVHFSTDHLLSLVNDILDYSKIEAGKMQLDLIEFSLNELLDNLKSTAQYKISQKGLDFSIKKDSHVPNFLFGDPVRLKQVLLNLLSNAIKFTEEGYIELMVKQLEEKENYVTLYFAITDTGIGIPKDKQALIFDSFTQGTDSTTRLFGGTGLGLAISKRLVDMQGGSINLRSEEGMGSTFTFTLKFKKTSGERYLARKERESPGIPKDLDNLRILLVEDNKVNQFVTSETILKWGNNLTIDLADDGQIALDMFRNKEYDLIIMDVQMPVMDGHTATRHIRNHFPESKKSVPILAMTAFATAGEADRCIAAGMDDYIPKPFNPRNLHNKIAALTGRMALLPENIPAGNDENGNSNGVPLVNLRYLDSLAQGDSSLKRKMLEVMIDEGPADLARINELLASKHWEKFAGAVHKFKSTATFIGNKELEVLLKKMEQQARNGEELEGLPHMVRQVEDAFSRIIGILKEKVTELHEE